MDPIPRILFAVDVRKGGKYSEVFLALLEVCFCGYVATGLDNYAVSSSVGDWMGGLMHIAFAMGMIAGFSIVLFLLVVCLDLGGDTYD